MKLSWKGSGQKIYGEIYAMTWIYINTRKVSRYNFYRLECHDNYIHGWQFKFYFEVAD